MARTTIPGTQIRDSAITGDDISTSAEVQVGSVAIGGSADSKAALTVTSTSKGLLPPRMTATQRDAISSPPAGLMVYDTTNNEPNYYNGSAWKKMDGSNAGTGCEAASLYGASSNTGYASAMNACSAGGSSAGTNQNWYHNGGSQIYSDSGCSSNISISSGGYFYKIVSGTVYYYYITAAGVVKTGQFGSTTNLNTTSGQGCG